MHAGHTLTTILRAERTQKRVGCGSPYNLSESSRNFSATLKSPVQGSYIFRNPDWLAGLYPSNFQPPNSPSTQMPGYRPRMQSPNPSIAGASLWDHMTMWWQNKVAKGSRRCQLPCFLANEGHILGRYTFRRAPHVQLPVFATFVLQSGNAVVSPKLFIEKEFCMPCESPGAIGYYFIAQSSTGRRRYRSGYGLS